MQDLTGQVFGRLTVIKYDAKKQQYKRFWICKCECGGEKSVREDHLLRGETESCGCIQAERMAALGEKSRKYAEGYKAMRKERRRQERLKRPPARDRRLNNIWYLMRRRCYDTKDSHYDRYGGRGIKICEAWEDFYEFQSWALKNGYSENLTIDRINNDDNYCPENCRWATRKQQSRNTKKTKFVTINGETHSCNEWKEITGINYRTLMKKEGVFNG